MAVGRDESALWTWWTDDRSGASALAVVADVTAADAPARIVAAAVEPMGGIDVLVNAAGIITSGTIETTEDDDVGSDDGRQSAGAVPADARRRAASYGATGAVVNVSSVNGLRSFPGVLAYCVSKAALDHLTRCAALELAPQRHSRQRRQPRRDGDEPAPPLGDE